MPLLGALMISTIDFIELSISPFQPKSAEVVLTEAPRADPRDLPCHIRAAVGCHLISGAG